MEVALLYHDIDRRDDGKYYGVAIVEFPENANELEEDELVDFLQHEDPLEVIYASTESGAYEEAKRYCKEKGFIVI